MLLFFASFVGSATGGFAVASEEDGAMYEVVAVAGDSDADDRILRLPIEGAIAEMASPVIGSRGGVVSQIRRALRLAGREDSIKAVLFDINSPGGGVTDTDEIHRLITAFKAEHGKPVFALFGDVSASGGYYVAAACDRIIARPTTITGSIGVIMNSLNYAEAAEKLGIESIAIKSERTPYKDMMSPTRPMRDEEREVLVSIVDEMYDRFIDLVDEGRPNLTRAQVEVLADGRIYSAQQALDNGLIDHIGNVEDAYALMREELDIDTARVVEHRRRPTLGEMLFGFHSADPSIRTDLVELLYSTTGPKFLYFWPGGR